MIAAEQQCFWIQVQLRLKQDSRVLLSPPSDEEWGQSWIVPLGGIAELGYKFEWKNTQCTLVDEEGHDLSVFLHHGCPMVPREVGRAMIDRLERQQIRLLRNPSAELDAGEPVHRCDEVNSAVDRNGLDLQAEENVRRPA